MNGVVYDSGVGPFIVCCNDVACFDFMRVGEGHDNETHMVFTRDVKDHGNQDPCILACFISDEYLKAMYDYGYYLKYGECEWYRKEHGRAAPRPDARLLLLARKLGCDDWPEVDALVRDGIRMVERAARTRNERDIVPSSVLDNSRRFTELVVAAAAAKWRIVSTLTYSGEVGEFWRHLENDFIGEVMRREKEHRGEYAVFAAGVSMSLF